MVIPGLIAGIIVGALVGADGGLGGVERLVRRAHRRLEQTTVDSGSGRAHRPRQRGAAKRRNRRDRQPAASAGQSRDAETATVAPGGMLFFDDYANTMVGLNMKPLTDRYGTSRAKLRNSSTIRRAARRHCAPVDPDWLRGGLLQDLSKEPGRGGHSAFLSAVPFEATASGAALVRPAGIGARPRPDDRAQRSRLLVGRMNNRQARSMSTRRPAASARAARRDLALASLDSRAQGCAVTLTLGACRVGERSWAEEAQFLGVTLDIASILALSSLVGLALAYGAGLSAKVGASALNQAMIGGLKVMPAVTSICAWVPSW